MAQVYEIVRVLDKKRLRNSESELHEYDLGRGRGLDVGFYVVVWPSQHQELKYDASAAWHGPYGSRRSALVMMSILRTQPNNSAAKSQMRGGEPPFVAVA